MKPEYWFTFPLTYSIYLSRKKKIVHDLKKKILCLILCTECLFLDIVGSTTHQAMETNYYTVCYAVQTNIALPRSIQFVCTT